MKKYILIVVISIFLYGCNIIPFTQKQKEILFENNVDFKKVQFYNSEEIILKQAVVDSSANEDYLETIILKPKTKMVCDSIYDNSIAVRFEVGDNKKILFGTGIEDTLNSKKYLYKIYASDWNENKGGVIQYGDKKFYIIKGSKTELYYKNKRNFYPKTKNRKAKGLKAE